jgi:hypothetical protein
MCAAVHLRFLYWVQAGLHGLMLGALCCCGFMGMS